MRTVAFGILWVLVALGLWLSIVKNPLDELALIRGAKVVPGRIVGSWEDPEDGDDGRTHWSHGTTYTYRLPDGREFTGKSEGSGRLRVDFNPSVQIEYLPDRPTISRIKGSGSDTVPDWLWRTVVGIALLALFASPGIGLLKSGFRELRSAGLD